MSIRAPSAKEFQSLLRISRASIASPPWFATPVDAQEDEDRIAVVFHAPARSHGRVEVEATDQSVTLLGRSRARRLCALPCAIDTNGIETSRSGDLLRVRLPKKRRPRDSTEASAQQSSP